MNYKSIIDVGGVNKVVVAINYKEENEQVVDVKTVESIHHILLLDRSCSMESHINRLIDNVQQCIDAIDENDYISIVWFSSVGQYRTVVKAARKYDKLSSILDTLRSTVGCTCFSESLKECNAIIDELGDLAPVSITLYTDGHAVVPYSTAEEAERCFVEIRKMKNKILQLSTIGFGQYYDAQLLKEFSSLTEYGEMIHSSKIDDYLTIFNHNFEKVRNVVSDKLTITTKDCDIVYLNRTFTKFNVGDFELTRLDKRKNQVFLINDSDFEFELNGVVSDSSSVKTNLNPATICNFYYAYAYNLYYTGKRLESLDILKSIGDKYLLDSHMKAFTFDECGEHLKNLEAAVFGNTYRMRDGYVSKDYLPSETAPCVMDVLNHLQETGTSFYVPFSTNLPSYNRIGKETEESINYFKPSIEEVRVPFTDLVYNKEHMNLSVRMVINGVVSFNPARAKATKMPATIDSIIYRNHTLIKDGNLNLKSIEVLLSDEDYTYLEPLSIFDFDHIMEVVAIEDKVYYRRILKLDYLPIINRSYINKAKSIDNIFDDTLRIAQLEARQKVVGYYLDKVEEKAVLKKVDKLAGYNVEQIAFLEEHGLSKELVYQGIGKSQKSKDECDSYRSRTMVFYIAGCTSWPKISDLMERRENGKKMTASMLIMNEQLNDLDNQLSSKNILLEKVNAALRDALLLERTEIKTDLNKLRNEIAVLKIAKCLSGDTFSGMSVDDKGEQYVEKNGTKMVCKFSWVTEYF